MTNPAFEAAKGLFVRRWGEMAASWGISRTMAEIHALLYVSAEPLCTDDVMARLAVSRGSASINLRELVNWGLISRVHRRGDRKEYFEAERDVWQMFETIIRQRRRREVQPILETIERCLTMVETAPQSGENDHREMGAFAQRLRDLLEFCEMMNALLDLAIRTGGRGLRNMIARLAEIAQVSPYGSTGRNNSAAATN